MAADTIAGTGAAPTQPELAQANLLRLRGDFAEAEQKCLTVLRRFPNDPAAHTLLGDICTDRRDWRRAIEWYELALDLSPNSVSDRQKLEAARRHLDEKDETETTQQLGLPKPNPLVPIFAAGAVAVLLFLAMIAVALNNRSAVTSPPPTITDPIIAPSATPVVKPIPNETVPDPTPKPVEAVPSTVTPAGESEEDRTLLQMVVSRSTYGDRVNVVEQDPRTKQAVLTFTLRPGDDPRVVANQLAKDCLTQSPETLIVTVRAIENDHLAFVADATRVRLTELEETSSTDSVLSREWTPGSTNPPPPAATTTASTGGAALPSTTPPTSGP